MSAASFLFLVLPCLIPAVTQAQSSMASGAYASLILEEWERYPLMELEDLYKFVHQSAMGPGHNVLDTTEARTWMEREIAGLTALPDLNEPMITPLTPDSGLIRVHLRPYLETGGDPRSLLASFIRSANEFEPSVGRLKRYWSAVVDLARSGRIPVAADSALALIETMAKSGFPAIHHSRQYSEAYRPAYRVVEKRLILRSIP